MCARCGRWTAYRATKGGQKRIDTVCRVCGARMRHTHRPQPFTQFQGVKMRWGLRGKGSYQSFSSVKDLIQCDPKVAAKLARRKNIAIQKAIAKRDGFDLTFGEE